MPAKELSPIEIYKLLPGTNCGECGETNCMAFAAKMVNREAALDECKPLLDEKYNESYAKLWALLKPSVKAVEIGVDENAITIGGEYVFYRHDFTYFHQPAMAVDVTDEMEDEEFETRIHVLNDFAYNYIGMDLTLDMLNVRCTSGDPSIYADAVKKADQLTRKPMMLVAHDPAVMKAGLEVVGAKRPLIHGATKDNWKEMAELAIQYRCPVVVYAPSDLDTLKSLALTLEEYGIKDIALDPGTQPSKYMSANSDNYTILRWGAINEEEDGLGYPLIGSPMVAWSVEEEDHILN
jgi:acetyl-CoA decarbonylase/synthase complex subunit gamma